MDSGVRTKIVVIAGLLAGSVSLLGVRFQLGPLVYLALTILFGLAVMYRSRIAIAGIAGTLLMVFQGAYFNRLYARDSHGDAIISNYIAENGWPVEELIWAWGDPDTPIMHFHTAIIYFVTDYPLFPYTRTKLLITALLPPIYIALTLLFTYCIAHRYFRNQSTSFSPIFSVFPLLLWVPFYEQKVSFRRQSLSILIFAMIVFFLFASTATKDRRLNGLLVFSVVLIPAVHHFASAVVPFFLGTFAIAKLGFNIAFLEKTSASDVLARSPSSTFLVFLAAISFLAWQIIQGFNSIFIVGIIVKIVSNAISEGLLSVGSQPVDVPYTIETTTIILISKVAPQFSYLAMIGGLTLVAAWASARKNQLDSWLITVVLFGFWTAGLLGLWLVSDSVTPDRVGTYFLVAGGWTVPVILQRIDRDFNLSAGATTPIIFAILAVFAAFLLPHFAIFGTQPAYDERVVSPRFEETEYTTAEFANQYGTAERYMGDANTKEILMPFTQQLVTTNYEEVLAGDVPPDWMAVFFSRNTHIYFGPTAEKFVWMNPPIFDTYNSHQMKVYTNGDGRIYT